MLAYAKSHGYITLCKTMVLDEFVCFDRVDIDIVYLSVCLSVCVFSLLSLSRCLLIYLFLLILYICLSVCLSVCLCVYSLLSLSRCLLIYLFLPLWPRGDYARRKQMIRRTDCVYWNFESYHFWKKTFDIATRMATVKTDDRESSHSRPTNINISRQNTR